MTLAGLDRDFGFPKAVSNHDEIPLALINR